MQQKYFIFFLVIAFVAGGFVGVSFGTAPFISSPDIAAEVRKEVRMMVDYGNGTLEIFEKVPQESETLFAFMKRLDEDSEDFSMEFETYEGLGALVTKIGDTKNGTDDKWWQYWVNARHADVGAESYIVRAGDIIGWRFAPFSGQ